MPRVLYEELRQDHCFCFTALMFATPGKAKLLAGGHRLYRSFQCAADFMIASHGIGSSTLICTNRAMVNR